MSKLEFLIVFISIILGFSVSEYLKGISFLIKNRKLIKFYPPLMLWQFLILAIMIQWWWASWFYSEHLENSMFNFLLVICIPMIYYLMVTFIFPTAKDMKAHKNDLSDFFDSNSKFFYSALILLFLVYETTGILFFHEELISDKVIIRSMVIITCLLNILNKSKLIEILNLTVTYFVMVYFIIIRL